jgi:excisionase family DNA binding protein
MNIRSSQQKVPGTPKLKHRLRSEVEPQSVKLCKEEPTRGGTAEIQFCRCARWLPANKSRLLLFLRSLVHARLSTSVPSLVPWLLASRTGKSNSLGNYYIVYVVRIQLLYIDGYLQVVTHYVPENPEKTGRNTEIHLGVGVFRLELCSRHETTRKESFWPKFEVEFSKSRRCIRKLVGRLRVFSVDGALTMADAREVMNIRQASQYLGVSPDTLYKYVNEQKIPAFKLGNRWRFKKSKLDQWMEEQSADVEGKARKKPKAARAAGSV